MCDSHWEQEQEYMGDEDSIDQMKEEDDNVVTHGRGRIRIYMCDEDGASQVKNEGEGVKHGGGRAHVDIGESRLVRRA